MDIEAKKQSVAEIKEAMYHSYKTKGLDKMIEEYAEMLSFQAVLNKLNIEVYNELSELLENRNDGRKTKQKIFRKAYNERNSNR